jgi:secondary thiamine-phosphate synthase enzyme
MCYIDITKNIQDTVDASGIKSGIALVYIPHTTAGVTINENGDPAVRTDLSAALTRAVPNQGFKHYEGNSDAHTKALLTGSSVSLIIEGGRLVLGTWQSVFFAEYDGPRTRKIHIKLMEDTIN